MPTKAQLRPAHIKIAEDVIKTDRGCWEYQGYTNRDGYGRVRLDNRLVMCHRLVWEMKHGTIPDGMSVCHVCDNPPCVNPDHLFLGTHQENMRDCILKQRQAAGERSSRRKLSQQDVDEIRDLRSRGWKQKDIATRYGIDPSNVSVITNKKTWRLR